MKILSFLAVILFSAASLAQGISGKAYYESKTTVDPNSFGNREMSEQMKQMIMERMKSMLEKTYVLTFNQNESIYQEEEKLQAGAGNPMMGFMNSFLPGPQYKNLEKDLYLEEREFFGKEFLVKDTLTDLTWEVGKESKQIGRYLAIKATAVKKIDENDFSMARRRNDEKNDAEKTPDSTETSTNTDDPWEQIEIPKEVIVTAWFTPQIPVGHGPGEYGGLPGLILELNVYRTTLLCSKIVRNAKEAETIKPLDNGEEVSRKEYNQIIADKMQEMRENFRGRSGRRGGRGQ